MSLGQLNIWYLSGSACCTMAFRPIASPTAACAAEADSIPAVVQYGGLQSGKVLLARRAHSQPAAFAPDFWSCHLGGRLITKLALDRQ